MHTSLPTWLALSTAAILPTATAFYPYHYTSGKTSSASTHSHRTSQSPPSPHAGTTRSITLPLRRIRTPSLRPRQNVYNIVNSNNSSQENSVAIDQDGRDLSYMVAVTFGDSTDEYHMLLDSAASNTWVMSEECSSEACKTHATFGKGDSSTLKVRSFPCLVKINMNTDIHTPTDRLNNPLQRNLRHRLRLRAPRNRHFTPRSLALPDPYIWPRHKRVR
jgi:hypothetical protein